MRLYRGGIFGQLPEDVASIFCRVSSNLVTLNRGVVYGTRNRRTVHPFARFLLRAKLKVFSMLLLKCFFIVHISIQ